MLNQNSILSSNTSGSGSADGDVIGPASSTDNAVVRYNGTTGKLVQNSAVTILDSGNVGIGTSSPASLLSLEKDGALGISLTRTGAFPSVCELENAGGYLVVSNDVTGIDFQTGATPASKVVITSTGNVGIGTSAPISKVTSIQTFGNNFSSSFLAEPASSAQGERGGYSFAATFEGTADNTARRSADIYSGFNGGVWGNEYLAFGVGFGGASNDTGAATIERMRITGAGRVGIGDAAPSYQLDVNGDAGINGDTYISAGTASRTAVAFANPVSTLCPELRMTRQGGSTSTNDFIKLDTSSGEVASIDASGGAFFAGNVGIGTAAPAKFLAISSNANAQTTATIPGIRIENTDTTASATDVVGEIEFFSKDASEADKISGFIKNVAEDAGTEYALTFGAKATGANAAEAMRIDSSGNVGIGTASPAYQLQLSTDSAAKPSTNTWTIASDARIKTETGEYTKGLDAVLALRPVTYRYNGKAGMIDDGEDKISIIAQEAITAFPECVGSYMTKLEEDDEEETEVLNWNGHALTFALVNAVKELTARIAALENN